MSRSRLSRVRATLGVALALLAALPAAHAVRQRGGEVNNVPDEPEWRESAAPPPPYPKDRDLVEFRLSGLTGNRFFVDASSLSVGADEVVRFVLVVQAAGNASNVSFSAIRCETQEWKDYAFGTRDRTWRVVADAQWRPIHELNRNNYQHTLFKEYFCYGGVMSGGPAGDAKRLVYNLKHPLVPDNRVPRRYNTRGN